MPVRYVPVRHVLRQVPIRHVLNCMLKHVSEKYMLMSEPSHMLEHMPGAMFEQVSNLMTIKQASQTLMSRRFRLKHLTYSYLHFFNKIVKSFGNFT